MISKKNIVSCFILFLVLFATYCLADGGMEEVLVTATGTEQELFEVNAAAEIYTQAEIQRKLVLDSAELLELEGGMDVVRSGGLGSVTGVQTRGANSGQTLFLINGHRISGATLGTAQFSLLDPSLVDRIEVVRGARSSLYGSDAIAGVVNFISIRDFEDRSGLALELGSYNTYKTTGLFQKGTPNFGFYSAASHTQADGFDATLDTEGFNKDDDAYKASNLHVGGRYQVGKTQLGLDYLHVDAESDSDSLFSPETSDPYAENKLSALLFDVSMQWAEFWQSRFGLSQVEDENKNFDRVSAWNESYFITTRQAANWLNEFRFSGQIISLGLDFEQTEVEATTTFDQDERTNSAAFLQWQSQYAAWRWLLGARLDQYEDSEDQTTHNGELAYNFSKQFKLFARWAEGFKEPTFNDLYWPEDAFSRGNPDLLPESSINRELGIKGRTEGFNWSLFWFSNDVKNLISWEPDVNFVYQPVNVGRARFDGVELHLNRNIGQWTMGARYSYVDPVDVNSGETLLNRSKRKLVLDLNHQINRWDYGLNLTHVDKRYVGFERYLDAYVLVDLYCHYQISQSLSSSLKINNLLDEDYQLNAPYRQEGSNARVKLQYDF